MPEVPHDETVALRLELGRERDRANALEAALRKEVLAIVRDGIAEYERLKTDIYRLRHERIRDLNTYGCQQEEIARLKAEVERLRKAGDAMAETILKDCIHKNDMAALKWYAANREQGCLVNPIKVAQYLPKPPAKEGKQS